MTAAPDPVQLQQRLADLQATGATSPALWRAAALLRRLPGQDAVMTALLAARVQALLQVVPPALQASSVLPSTRNAALADLLQHLAAGRDAAPQDERIETAPTVATLQASPLLEEARQTWRTLRARSQLQQALAQSQEHAGPLNSSRLLLRALEAMQAASPGYAECFLAHLDALAALEALVSEAQRVEAAPASKRPARTRKRRD